MGILNRLFGNNENERQELVRAYEEIGILPAMTVDEYNEWVENNREVIEEIRKQSGQYYYCGICGWVHISRFPNCH